MPQPSTVVSARLRVLVADDHQGVREEMTDLLDAHFEVVGAVADGRTLVEAAIALKPDVIVSDVQMPDLSGPEAMTLLRTQRHHVPFVLVSLDPSIARYWIEQGAAAFVHKDDMSGDLVPAIHSAANGKIYLSRRVRSRFSQ